MRIHLTGASGSGTTTLGRSVAGRLGYRIVDSDDCYWLPSDPPFTTKRPVAERLAMALAGPPDDVVHSGSIVGWGAALEDSFDLIVFLWVPAAIRLERLRRRETDRLGSIDEDFVEWASRYDDPSFDGRSRARHEGWLGERTCAVLRIEGDVTPEASIDLVMRAVQRSSSQMGD